MSGRKDTIYCARDKSEEQEINRIIESYMKTLNIEITKLEASAIQAQRSKEVFWDNKKARDFILKLRGML
jgi:uncharacterized ubiquitin-like protein YukD